MNRTKFTMKALVAATLVAARYLPAQGDGNCIEVLTRNSPCNGQLSISAAPRVITLVLDRFATPRVTK